MRVYTSVVATALLLLAGASVTAQQVYVATTGSDITGDGSAGMPYKTIGFAAGAASPSDTIHVAAGTYGTDDLIVLGGKDLTIVGAGVGVTIVKPHATSTTTLATGSPTSPGSAAGRVVFTVAGSSTVCFRDLTVDGDFNMPPSGRLHGFHYSLGADGTIENVEVRNCRASTLDGAQTPIAILVRGDNGGDGCDVTVRSCWIHDFGKAGIATMFNATGEVQYTFVEGAGPTAAVAQIGVQISYGSVFVVNNNTVADAEYTPQTYAAAGVMFYDQGASCVMQANEVVRCEDNILVAQSTPANVPIFVLNNRSTGALGRAMRVEGNSGVTINNNTLHGTEIEGFKPTWDTTTSGNTWSKNNYSNYSGVGSYPIAGPVPSYFDALPRNGCDEFAPLSTIEAAGVPADVVAGDFDGAGTLDLAFIANAAVPRLSIGLGAGGGAYAISILAFGSGDAYAVSLVTGEFNGAPGLDLAAITRNVGTATTENRFYIFANNGTGGFVQLHSQQFDSSVKLPSDIAAGDLDGDGVDDLGVSYQGLLSAGGGRILMNGGDGTSWTSTALAGPSLACKGIAMGPISSASDIDVALTEGDAATGKLRIYDNDGTGSLSEIGISPIALAADPTAVALMDSDTDGDNDVVVASTGAAGTGFPGYVTTLYNELPGGMPAQVVRTDLGPVDIATGNVARDTDPDTVRPDAIVVNLGARDITLLGDWGPVGPAIAPLCRDGGAPAAAILADMTGNGFEDMVVADSSTRLVRLYRGQSIARTDLYGAGCAGTGGKVPLISARGVPAVPTVGNSSYGLRLTDARPLASSIWVISAFPGPSLAPCTLQVGTIASSLGVITNAAGGAMIPLPIPPLTDSIYFYNTWAVLDPAGSFLGGIALSQGLRVQIGR